MLLRIFSVISCNCTSALQLLHTVSLVGIGGSRPGHTRAKPRYTLLPMIKMWLKLSNFSHKVKVFYVDNPLCPGSFCVLQPPILVG